MKRFVKIYQRGVLSWDETRQRLLEEGFNDSEIIAALGPKPAPVELPPVTFLYLTKQIKVRAPRDWSNEIAAATLGATETAVNAAITALGERLKTIDSRITVELVD